MYSDLAFAHPAGGAGEQQTPMFHFGLQSTAWEPEKQGRSAQAQSRGLTGRRRRRPA